MVGKRTVARRSVALACALLALTGALAVNPNRAHAALGAPYTHAWLENVADGTTVFSATSIADNGSGPSSVNLSLGTGSFTPFLFQAPAGATLVPGTYDIVFGFTPTATQGSLTMLANGVDCDILGPGTGQVALDDFSVDGAGALLSASMRLDFECNSRHYAGAISYASTADYRVRRIAPAAVDFGPQHVGTNANRNVQITNDGPSALHPAAPSIAGANPRAFGVVSNTCGGATLASGASCTITVSFRPSAVGGVSADLVLHDDLALLGREVHLQGSGTPPLGAPNRQLRITGDLQRDTLLRFYDQRVGTYGEPRSARLQNLGDATIHLRRLAIGGRDPEHFFGTTDCGDELAPGDSCYVHTYFLPLRRGEWSMTLIVDSDATNGTSRRYRGGGTATLGYYLVRAGGQTSAFGDAADMGSLRGRPPASIIAVATTPNGDGLWLAGADGSVYAGGNAVWKGSMRGTFLPYRVVGMSATPTGNGYWLVARDGGIFAFGDAKFRGSTGAIRLNQPIVGMASTASGKGYWLVASDGGIFAFGDAKFYGSTGAMRLNQPIVGMARTPSGRGYWLVASDGGIFAFGDARFYGSTGAMHLTSPIAGMAAAPDGRGYWFVALDGGLFSFGPGVAFYGSLGGRGLYDITAMAGTAPPLTWLYGNAAGAKAMAASAARGRIVPEGSFGRARQRTVRTLHRFG
jgi:hypothetical protein